MTSGVRAAGFWCGRHCVMAVTLLAVTLAGCSTLFDSGSEAKAKAPAKLSEFKQTAEFKVRWNQNIGKAGGNPLQPAVVGEAVYVANARGDVLSLERKTARRLWDVNSGFPISAGVGAGDGLIVVGGGKGDVVAYDEAGKARWKVRVSSEVMGTPQIADGIVVVRTGDGRIAGLGTLDGRRQWLYERATPALTVRGQGAVAIAHGVVYAGFAAGKLVAINLNNGAVLWEAAVSQPRGNTELERISDITSTPVVDDDQVCAVAFQGRVACFELKRGSLLWSRELSSDKGMALQGKYLYVTDSNGVVSALDKSTGSSLWKNEKLSMRSTSAPLVAGNHVVVGDFEGYLHALNREDGGFAARFRTENSPILTAPVGLDGGMLVLTSDGGLYSLSLN